MFFSNIGKKIKTLAKVIFVILLIALPILGIVSIVDGDVLYGCIMLILGPVIAWIASWFLYGFGELIDKVSDIEYNTRGERTVHEIKTKGISQSPSQSKMSEDNSKISKIEKLREKYLITEEEYQQLVEKYRGES